MRIEFDNPAFERALKSYFSGWTGRSVCAVDDDGAVLGGCGFSPVSRGTTSAYILGLRKGWATRAFYAAMLRFPFVTMGAQKCFAHSGPNVRSENINKHLGMTKMLDGVYVMTAETALQKADAFEDGGRKIQP